jgi:hypothetical protein
MASAVMDFSPLDWALAETAIPKTKTTTDKNAVSLGFLMIPPMFIQSS